MTQNNNKPIYTIEYYDKEKTIKRAEYWTLNVLYHREDGPAIIWYYYRNESIYKKEYFINGNRHREDGPADIFYYENGNVRYKYQ